MRLLYVLVLSLLTTAVYAGEHSRTLIRTIQLGAAQSLPASEIREIAFDDRTQYHDYVLARAALLVLDEDKDWFPAWPPQRLLERTLDQLVKGSHNDVEPGGFRNEHLVATLVYAMVMAGLEEQAINALERQLDTRVSYKLAVVLQNLRNIGSRSATELIQHVANENKDASHLATSMLADYHYPFLTQLAERAHTIPVEQRNQSALLQKASGDACSIPASLAVYWLGFFDDGESEADTQSIALLRRLNGIECYYTRFFARRSLAMRNKEDLPFWIEQYAAEQDPWQRAQIVRIAYAHFGRKFADLALDLLASEGSQYVEWELMHGYFEASDSDTWLNTWDIWLPPAIQFRINHSDKYTVPQTAVGQVLDWLAAGNRPEDSAVFNQLLYRIAGVSQGQNLIHFLDYFSTLSGIQEYWWVLQVIDSPKVLPYLRQWQQQYASQQEAAILDNLIKKLQDSHDSHH